MHFCVLTNLCITNDGAKTNMLDLQGNNALTHYVLHSLKTLKLYSEEHAIMINLLHAAGETIDEIKSKFQVF